MQSFRLKFYGLRSYRWLNFYHATRMLSADYAVARCLSVCPSVHHTPIFCLNSYTYPRSFFTRRCNHISPVLPPPAALASCAAVCCVQDCDSRPLVLVQQCPGLPGQRLSAHCRRPCLTTAFCRHSNTRQSDVQQFWRQDLCHLRTTSLDQSAVQSQTMWAVIRPVQVVTDDIFIQIVRPRCSVNCAEQKYFYLLTYLLTQFSRSRCSLMLNIL